MKQVDAIIVGGGMVGAASALSLAQQGISVLLVEHQQPRDFSAEQPVDLRVSAISLGSEQLLRQLGAWQQIEQWRVCPYRRLGVWESELSYTEFNNEQISQSHLGHIIENRIIQLALWQQIVENPLIELACPASVKSMTEYQSSIDLVLTDMTVNAKVIIAADGARSQIRQLAKIGCTGWQYQQSAMLIHVETEKEQQDITWQHFRPSGPVAMLPLSGKQASLVWYHDKDKIAQLSALSNQALTEQIHQHFPKQLGKVKVLNHASFPLTRQHANSYVKGRVVLMGDSAHTINPLAGQGVNLGFKDVKAFAETVATAISENNHWHDSRVLAGYENKRRKDNLLMMSAMDLLYAGFSNDLPLFKLVRNAGLFLANRAPILKDKALAYACGVE